MKDRKRMQGTKLQRELMAIIEQHDDMKGCYFWKPPSSASMRRRYERERSASMAFLFRGALYEIDQECSCSCRNIYYSLSVHVDGRKKDIRSLKRLAVA